MKKKIYLSVSMACLLFFMTSIASAAVDKVICVPWQGDVNKQHTAISGVAAQLKGVVKTTDTTAVYYKWVFGDGTPDSAVSILGGATKYDVVTTHTYTAAIGTPFTAKLQVSNTSPFALSKENPYLLKVEDNILDAQINITIDKALWWLYTNPNNGGSTYDGSAFMSWYDSYNVYAAPTASTIQAFAINNHKIKGNPDVDPYVEAVQLGMNFLIKGNVALQAYSPINDTYTIGGTTFPGNGIGIMSWYGPNHQVYEGGQVMDAIIASGALPGDSTGRDFSGRLKTDPNYHEWTYREVLQDLADMYILFQRGTGAWPEWEFWSTQNDNSSSQWAAIGLMPAMASPWNIHVPDNVKTNLVNWLGASYCASGNTGYLTGSYFGYQGACYSYNDNAFNTTPSGMVMMSFVGQIGYDDPSTPADERDPKWIGAEKFMSDNWTYFMNSYSPSWGNLRSYGYYAMAKAMRLAVPQQVGQITKSDGTHFDWYHGDGGTNKGLAQRLVETQVGYGTGTGGYWNGELTSQPLTTAWMTIVLKPALFASSPIACFSAAPNPSYPNQDIAFNPACSGHSETGKTIANLTRFEWDWNNDGTFDQFTTTPTIVMHQFACASIPCKYPVKLRVTDDSTPPLTASAVVDINITNPPHPPVANAGGPYAVTTCSNDTLTLDGSKSFDQDEGQHEAGCTTCPNDTITAWDWDLVPPLTFDTINKSGKIVSLSAADIASFFGLGSQNIGLRVTDNTLLAYPGSGQPNLTNAAFGTVDVKDGCICNTIKATPKSGVVQLAWTGLTGNQTYDILRSTAGPNTGFTVIAANYATPYQAYQDRSVVNGTTYYYRVTVKGSNLCTSASVSATPKALVR